MKRYAPFASLGILLALLLHAAVPAPIDRHADSPQARPDPTPPPEHDVELEPEMPAASEDWIARHSIVPRARIERPERKVDGENIHSPRAGSKRRR